MWHTVKINNYKWAHLFRAFLALLFPSFFFASLILFSNRESKNEEHVIQWQLIRMEMKRLLKALNGCFVWNHVFAFRACVIGRMAARRIHWIRLQQIFPSYNTLRSAIYLLFMKATANEIKAKWMNKYQMSRVPLRFTFTAYSNIFRNADKMIAFRKRLHSSLFR